jgi:hypothetical protein
MSQQLLGLLSDVLDVRDVFPRVSEIVAAAIPHDRLVLWLFQDQVTHVASNDDGPLIESVRAPRLDPRGAMTDSGWLGISPANRSGPH